MFDACIIIILYLLMIISVMLIVIIWDKVLSWVTVIYEHSQYTSCNTPTKLTESFSVDWVGVTISVMLITNPFHSNMII